MWSRTTGTVLGCTLVTWEQYQLPGIEMLRLWTRASSWEWSSFRALRDLVCRGTANPIPWASSCTPLTRLQVVTKFINYSITYFILWQMQNIVPNSQMQNWFENKLIPIKQSLCISWQGKMRTYSSIGFVRLCKVFCLFVCFCIHDCMNIKVQWASSDEIN